MRNYEPIIRLKTPRSASYPLPPETEVMAGEAALPNPRPASSRGEGNGAARSRACGRTVDALVLVSMVSMFAGCAVGPNYSRPTVAAPTTWKESKVATNAAALPPEWWKIFNDTELDSLETQAVEANQDLKRAVTRVTEARALARVSKAELYPNISAGSAYSRSRLSENRANAPLKDFESDDFSGSFDLSYELDIWGRVRRSVQAANADAAAVATDLEVVLLTLTADVARNYYFLRSLDNERLVIEATIALRRDAVQLQETRN